MDHLQRELAPISVEGWAQIEDEATSRLTTYLAGRKLVDFSGPHGWTYSATNIGRVAQVGALSDGITAKQRRVLPLVELRAEFSVSRDELDDAARGASDIDLTDLDRAIKDIAVGENMLIFHGYEAGGINGVTQAASHEAQPLTADFADYPRVVAQAVNTLLSSGVAGPYGLAISPVGYTGIVESTEQGGYLVLEHLRHILGGPLVWAPGVTGAVVMSLRGGDFILDVGQDISIGYRSHDAETVRLYLEESLTFRVTDPDAAVALVRP
jgi:uncharacterized linocin/CFP29 family protein